MRDRRTVAPFPAPARRGAARVPGPDPGGPRPGSGRLVAGRDAAFQVVTHGAEAPDGGGGLRPASGAAGGRSGAPARRGRPTGSPGPAGSRYPTGLRSAARGPRSAVCRLRFGDRRTPAGRAGRCRRPASALGGEGEGHRGPRADLAARADAAAVTFDDPPDAGQAHAGTGKVLHRVQPLERLEEPVGQGLVEPGAVVADIDSTVSSAVRSAPNSMVAPARLPVNFQALSTRFCTALRSRSGSPTTATPGWRSP